MFEELLWLMRLFFQWIRGSFLLLVHANLVEMTLIYCLQVSHTFISVLYYSCHISRLSFKLFLSMRKKWWRGIYDWTKMYLWHKDPLAVYVHFMFNTRVAFHLVIISHFSCAMYVGWSMNGMPTEKIIPPKKK